MLFYYLVFFSLFALVAFISLAHKGVIRIAQSSLKKTLVTTSLLVWFLASLFFTTASFCQEAKGVFQCFDEISHYYPSYEMSYMYVSFPFALVLFSGIFVIFILIPELLLVHFYIKRLKKN